MKLIFALISLGFGLTAFAGNLPLTDTGKLDSESFARMNPVSEDLFQDHLIANEEGAGTRGGGDGKILTVSDQASAILNTFSNLKTVLSSLDYDDLKNEQIKASYLFSLEQSFADRIQKSKIIILKSCKDESGIRSIVQENRAEGTICISQSALPSLTELSHLELASILIQIRFEQFLGTILTPETSKSLAEWITKFSSESARNSDFLLLQAGYRLSLPSTSPSSLTLKCLVATGLGSARVQFSEIQSQVRSSRIDANHRYYFRLESGYAKMRGSLRFAAFAFLFLKVLPASASEPRSSRSLFSND